MLRNAINRTCQTASRSVAARGMSTKSLSPLLTNSLKESDPHMFDIMEQEKRRQRDSLTLIPSENHTSSAVLEALGSVMQNKYSEGYPGARYYGGNEFIDQAEQTCQQRALAAYKLDPAEWGVNVQTLSGTPANFAVYTALLKPHERMMALDLPHGGHLSHGYQTATKKISAVSTYFECLPYRLDESTGLIDYDTLEKNATLYRPQLMVMGASAYARHIDYARFRKIADINKSYLMCDMAHVSGAIAGGQMPSPFEFADVVTTTTHKTLRGPRGAMIFYRKGLRSTTKKGKQIMFDLEEKINFAVFPGHQGGPHNHTITALSVALKQAASPEFAQYQKETLANCKTMADTFLAQGYDLVSGGTDNHMLLMNLRNKGVAGNKVERVLELANIAINKNTVPGDVSALNPGGIRMGSPALTTRGLEKDDFIAVCGFVDRGIKISSAIQANAGTKKMSDFTAALEKDDCGIADLKADVTEFARKFPTVGFTEDSMVYRD